MGAIQDIGKGKIKITYGGLESPLIGIDATHQSGLYLNPQSLASAGGMISQDGYLNSVFLNARANLLVGIDETSVYTLGDVQLQSVTQGSSPTVTKFSWGFVVVSNAEGLTVYEYRTGIVFGVPTAVTISANQATNLTWYTVNGVVYITGLGLAAIYAYTPNPSGTSTFTLLTNFVGGSILGELNGRLICLACDQITAGVYSYNPYLISWSAGEEQYGVWNPLDMSSLVTGAGFNQLPDVADEITGFFTIGPTGYIIRKQGVSEMTPLNSGTEPFDFNHMWASNKGTGSVYPNSVSQYGSLGAFLADVGIFTLGLSGINEIEGTFWAEINRLLDELFFNSGIPLTQLDASVAAGLIPLYVNGERRLTYALYIPTSDGILCLGDILTQNWNEVSCFTAAQASQVQIRPISNSALLRTGSDQSVAVVSAIFTINSVATLCLFTLDDTFIVPPSVSPAPFADFTPTVTLPVEEVNIFADVTIDSIVFVGDADVTLPSVIKISPGVNGVAYTPVNFNGQAQIQISYPSQASTSGATQQFTGKFPQLSFQAAMDILNSSSLRIYKIVMFGRYDATQTP